MKRGRWSVCDGAHVNVNKTMDNAKNREATLYVDPEDKPEGNGKQV